MLIRIIIKTLGIALVLAASSTLASAQREIYKADLIALNSAKTGTVAKGSATIEVVGSNLKIYITMIGTPANMQHWEHFHGYPDGKDAICATSAQDANHDGYVDLTETGAVSGTTMVPFDASPEKMNIPNDTYPNADSKGHYEYTKIVPLKELSKKFADTFKGGEIHLDKRVIYIHGVLSSAKLPGTVGGQVATYDPHVTLPIACGKIRRVQ